MAAFSVPVIPTMQTNKFAFVNYTDLASMHDASTYTQIRKHAMKQVGAAKKRPRGRNQTTVELFWVPSAPEPVISTTSPADNQPKHDCQSCVAKTVARSGRTADDRALYDAFIRSLSCKVDPFGTVSVTLDAGARELLQYFTFYASRYPNTWTYSSSPLLPNDPVEHKQAIDRTLSAALQDALLGHSLLATVAARVSYTNGVVRRRFQQKELSLTQTALRLLRTRLEASSTDVNNDNVEVLIASSLHLGSAAFYKGDVSTASLHIKAAAMLADRIGGINAIRDPYIRGRIISFDDLIACMELKQCLLDDTYDPESPPSTTANMLLQLNDTSTAADLFAMKVSLLPSNLRELVLQIVQHQQTAMQFAESDDLSTFKTLAIRQWLALRLLAIRNRLLALEITDRRTHILRVVLVMWTLLPSTDMSEAIIANALAPKLKHLLGEVPLLDWTGNEDTYLWYLLVGYSCSQERSQSQTWFAGEIKWQLRNTSMVASKDISPAAALIAFQKRNLYNEAVQQPATERLARWLSRG